MTSRAQLLAAHLAARAYADGFARGADPRRARRRHIVDPATHAHWRRGFDAGRSAAEAAELAYLEDQLAAPAELLALPSPSEQG